MILATFDNIRVKVHPRDAGTTSTISLDSYLVRAGSKVETAARTQWD